MKSVEQIEESIRRLHVEAGNERRERVRRDLVDVHKQRKEKTPAFSRWHLWRIVVRQKPVRIAAVVAFAVLLVGGFSLSSQAGNVVNSTLARLKAMIMEMRTKKQIDPPAMPPAPQNDASEQTADANRRTVMCEARFYAVSPNEQDVWQTLREQGIELVQGAANPETYSAVLSSEQAARFEASLTVAALTAPRIIVQDGEQAMIGTDVLALACQPTISGDGKHIESTLSFHDGERGFELTRVSVENDGVLLLRVKGVVLGSQENPDAQETLILVRVNIE